MLGRTFRFICALMCFLVISGCWWSHADGNVELTVTNKTSSTVTVGYRYYDDFFATDFGNTISLGPGKTLTVRAFDKLGDTDVTVACDGVTREYEIDPDFWGDDSLIIRLADFFAPG